MRLSGTMGLQAEEDMRRKFSDIITGFWRRREPSKARAIVATIRPAKRSNSAARSFPP
jgi:hypothetical protein